MASMGAACAHSVRADEVYDRLDRIFHCFFFVGSAQTVLNKLESGQATRRAGWIESWHGVQDR